MIQKNIEYTKKVSFLICKSITDHLLPIDDNRVVLEGIEPVPGRAIIFSFPSEEDADNWWNDEGYQELSKHRRAATDITLQRIKGLPPRT